MSVCGNYKETAHFYFVIVFILTVHQPNCVPVVPLHVLNLMFSFFIATSYYFADLGNNFFNMKWHCVSTATKSTLYGTTGVAWLDDVFKFSATTELLLLKVMEFMLIEFKFTFSISSSTWCCSIGGSMQWNFLFCCFCRPLWNVYPSHRHSGLFPWLYPILPLCCVSSEYFVKVFCFVYVF